MTERHVVALSGGKDSTAMALRLAEVEPRDYVYICTPTGNENDAMFAHWRMLATLLGKPIVPVVGGTLVGLIRKQQALPNVWMRWCTRMLKIAPICRVVRAARTLRVVCRAASRRGRPRGRGLRRRGRRDHALSAARVGLGREGRMGVSGREGDRNP